MEEDRTFELEDLEDIAVMCNKVRDAAAKGVDLELQLGSRTKELVDNVSTLSLVCV